MTTMTKITRRFTAGLLALSTFVMLGIAPQAARAESLGEAQLSDLIKLRSALRVNASSSTIMSLYYVGTATEAVVRISSDVIQAEAPFGTIDTANFGAAVGAYDLSAAAYDTLGELCDAIDALTNYECVLQGGKRDDNSGIMRDVTAASETRDLKAAGGYDVSLDTDPVNGGGVGTTVFDIRLGIVPNLDKRVILKTCTTNVNVAADVRVYGKLRKHEGNAAEAGILGATGETRNDTTEVWRVATADDTDLQIPVDIDDNGWLSFAQNAHVVVSAGNGTGSQAAANFLECSWLERQ